MKKDWLSARWEVIHVMVNNKTVYAMKILSISVDDILHAILYKVNKKMPSQKIMGVYNKEEELD
jgi:hypothetical protein